MYKYIHIQIHVYTHGLNLICKDTIVDVYMECPFV